MQAPTTSDWVDLGDDMPPPPPPSNLSHERAPEATVASWLAAAGLSAHQDQIIDTSGAESIEDFKILDSSAIEQIVTKCSLKLVAAERFRRAIGELSADNPRQPCSQSLDQVSSVEPPPPDTAVTPRKLQEAIAICIDRSGSMGSPFAELHLNIPGADGAAFVPGAMTQRTRMEAVKAMFYAFRDRVESLRDSTSSAIAEHATALGLLQYDDKVETLTGLTTELDRFESIVDDLKKRGTTAIYSAIVEGARMLEPIAVAGDAGVAVDGGAMGSGSSTDLRILVLTDGNSNCGVGPEAALEAAHGIGAVVDAIIVGDQPDVNLRKIVAATGGLCFQMRTLGEGFELLEAESVVSLKARRGGVEKPREAPGASPGKPRPSVDFASIPLKNFSIAPPAAMPAADPAVAMKLARVVDVSQRVAALDLGSSDGPGAAMAATVAAGGGGGGGGALTKRVLKELRAVAGKKGEGVHIFPTESDVTLWRVLLEGPPASPFAGGVFVLNVQIPNEYPLKPPVVRFDAPVPYHCNVSESGAICMRILHDGWSPALTVPKVLEAVRELLAAPDTDSALRQWIAEITLSHRRSNGQDTRYVDEARRRTVAEASRSVAEWRKEWGGASA